MVNRWADIETEYIDLVFNGNLATIEQAKQQHTTGESHLMKYSGELIREIIKNINLITI